MERHLYRPNAKHGNGSLLCSKSCALQSSHILTENTWTVASFPVNHVTVLDHVTYNVSVASELVDQMFPPEKNNYRRHLNNCGRGRLWLLIELLLLKSVLWVFAPTSFLFWNNIFRREILAERKQNIPNSMQTDTLTNTQSGRETCRHTDRQKRRQTQTYRKTDRQLKWIYSTYRRAERIQITASWTHTGMNTDREIDKEIRIQRERQTDTQTDIGKWNETDEVNKPDKQRGVYINHSHTHKNEFYWSKVSDKMQNIVTPL